MGISWDGTSHVHVTARKMSWFMAKADSVPARLTTTHSRVKSESEESTFVRSPFLGLNPREYEQDMTSCDQET